MTVIHSCPASPGLMAAEKYKGPVASPYSSSSRYIALCPLPQDNKCLAAPGTLMQHPAAAAFSRNRSAATATISSKRSSPVATQLPTLTLSSFPGPQLAASCSC